MQAAEFFEAMYFELQAIFYCGLCENAVAAANAAHCSSWFYPKSLSKSGGVGHLI
jgi:hypothetical protein